MSTQSPHRLHTIFSVITQFGYTDEILSLLKKNILGTKGKIRYRQKHIEKRLKQQSGLRFLTISVKNSLFGTIGLDSREVFSQKKSHRALYVRYLSIRNSYHSNAKETDAPSQRSPKNSLLNSLINEELNNQLEKEATNRDLPPCSYAYVESNNLNSLNLCRRFGYVFVRKINTLFISRIRKKSSDKVHPVLPEELREFDQHLEAFYSDHSLFYNVHSTEQDSKYFVFKEHGKIKAGLRARPVSWEIVELPDKFMSAVFTFSKYLPIIRKIIQPSSLEFIAIDKVWFTESYSHSLFPMIHHALYETDHHLAFFWGDSDSEVSKIINDPKKAGVFSKIQKPVSAHLMIRNLDSDSQITNIFTHHPVYVQSPDMT